MDRITLEPFGPIVYAFGEVVTADWKILAIILIL
jgi:hypothetical protein